MKFTLFVLSMFLLTTTAKADQLAYITKSQAIEATEYLLKESKVILWCACCDDMNKTLVMISGVTYQHTGYQDYYEVSITGIDADGNSVNQAIDLAYVHVQIEDDAEPLGEVLGYECDPCTLPFRWKVVDKSSSQTKTQSSKADRLRELKALLDEGVLNEDEFASEKKKILDEK